MTIINPKSIAGVTSITTPSGSDNLFTVHTNNTTERIRINNDGDVIVGSGITVSPDGDIFTTGVTTATTFVGALTGNVTGNISGGTVAGSTGTFTGNVAVSGANITLQDSGGASDDRLVIGAGTDLSIYHDSTDSIISNATGDLYINNTGGSSDDVHIQAADDILLRPQGGENGIKVIGDGAVELYHDNSKKFETSSTGGTLTGDLYATSRLFVNTTDAGESNGDEATFANTGGNAGITIRSAVDAETKIYFSEGTSGGSQYRGAINYNHNTNYMAFSANETEKIRILSTGGITFNGDTATANALDDYEEGTWTPDWHGANALGTITYGSYNEASYVKIGNQVTVRGYTEFNGSSGASGFWFIDNLPFTVGGGDNRRYRSVGSVMIENYNLPDDVLDVVLYVERNNNDAQLRGIVDNATSSANISANTDDNFEIYFTVTYPTV